MRLLVVLVAVALAVPTTLAVRQQSSAVPQVARWRRVYSPERPELPRLETLYQGFDHKSKAPIANLWAPGTPFDVHVFLSTSSKPLKSFPGTVVAQEDTGAVAIPDRGVPVLVWKESGTHSVCSDCVVLALPRLAHCVNRVRCVAQPQLV